MARNARKLPPKGSVNPKPRTHDVGYGKPPVETRFKSGQSGNPRGRPKGARTKKAVKPERLEAIIIGEAYRLIKVNEGDQQVSMPLAQAVMRSLCVNAAKGQPRAQKLFIDLVRLTEQAQQARHDEMLEAILAYKLGWSEELDRRKSLGLAAPDLAPHPDDIIINLNTGGIEITGPMTADEQKIWRRIRTRIKDAEQAIAEGEDMLAKPEHQTYRRQIEGDIVFEKRLRDRLRTAIGNWDR